jgi:hypothetical protein
MIATIASVLFSFVLVTIVGGIFAQRLQHRNWIRQQYISNQDRRISELKTIFADLDSLLSKRLYRTRRLLYALRRNDQGLIESRLKDYDQIISDWNEKRNSFQIRLVRVISVQLAHEFEHDLSRRFVAAGLKLERLTRAARQKSAPNNFRAILTGLEEELNLLSRSVYEFLREIYKHLQVEQDRLFYVDSHMVFI